MEAEAGLQASSFVNGNILSSCWLHSIMTSCATGLSKVSVSEFLSFKNNSSYPLIVSTFHSLT